MWPVVIQLFYYIVASLVVSYLTRTKGQRVDPENPQGAPTIEDDAIIPVVFGTRPLTNNNVLWWGDLRTEAIKKGGGKK